MSTKAEKNALTGKALAQNKIYYREDLAEVIDKPLGCHMGRLKEILLDFDCTIPDRLGISPDDANDQLLDAEFSEKLEAKFGTLKIPEFERIRIRDSVLRYRNITQNAVKRFQGCDQEPGLQFEFVRDFIEPLQKQMKVSDACDRRTSRIKFYCDYFEWVPDRLWTLFGERQEFMSDRRKGLTTPKPDCVLFFPIHNFDSESASRIEVSEAFPWTRSPKKAVVENFSGPVLKHLTGKGLEPSTLGVFRKKNKPQKNKGVDAVCFPWLVVELKASTKDRKQCYNQAANAGAAAIMMLEQLSKYAVPRYQEAHIPPVVTMTVVNKEIRLWVTQLHRSAETRSRSISMDCIWIGDMTRVCHVIYLEAILENLHTWATQTLRPWISGYIDLWLDKHPLVPRPAKSNEPQTPVSVSDATAVDISLSESAMMAASNNSDMAEQSDSTSTGPDCMDLDEGSKNETPVTEYNEFENKMDISPTCDRKHSCTPKGKDSKQQLDPGAVTQPDFASSAKSNKFCVPCLKQKDGEEKREDQEDDDEQQRQEDPEGEDTQLVERFKNMTLEPHVTGKTLNGSACRADADTDTSPTARSCSTSIVASVETSKPVDSERKPTPKPAAPSKHDFSSLARILSAAPFKPSTHRRARRVGGWMEKKAGPLPKEEPAILGGVTSSIATEKFHCFDWSKDWDFQWSFKSETKGLKVWRRPVGRLARK